jgi:hypothetical protein
MLGAQKIGGRRGSPPIRELRLGGADRERQAQNGRF